MLSLQKKKSCILQQDDELQMGGGKPQSKDPQSMIPALPLEPLLVVLRQNASFSLVALNLSTEIFLVSLIKDLDAF